MQVAAHLLAAQIAEMTPLWARESALDHRNLMIADEPGRRLAAADALALASAKTAVRVAIAVADPAAVDARLAALRSSELGGLRLLSASEAVQGDDRAIVRGSFDIVVISVQRLGDLLTRAPQLAESLGMVVVDGIDALVDPARSARWDRVLTLLRASSLPPRLVALGPADASCAGLARWLDAAIEGEAQLGLVAAAETLPELPLEPIVLQMTATGRIGHAGELRRMVLTSFAGHACYQRLSAAGEAREGFSEALDAALERCMEAGVLAYRSGHGLVATEAGRASLDLGLDLQTMASLERWVGSLSASVPSLLELCVELARTPAGAQAPLPPADMQECRAAIVGQARALHVAHRPVFRWLSEELWSCSADTELALRRAMILHGILDGEGPATLARTYGGSPAQMVELAAAFARPLLAVVALYRQSGRPAVEAEALLRAARGLDPLLTGFALRPPERRAPATPPKPARTRGPQTAARPRRARPRSTRQVTLFAE